jgi:hypothetical protein
MGLGSRGDRKVRPTLVRVPRRKREKLGLGTALHFITFTREALRCRLFNISISRTIIYIYASISCRHIVHCTVSCPHFAFARLTDIMFVSLALVSNRLQRITRASLSLSLSLSLSATTGSRLACFPKAHGAVHATCLPCVMRERRRMFPFFQFSCPDCRSP